MTDVDQLFQTRPLAELKELEQKTRDELTRKQHELRGLVSGRYHDLLEATDVLVNMRNAVQSMQSELDRLLKVVEPPLPSAETPNSISVQTPSSLAQLQAAKTPAEKPLHTLLSASIRIQPAFASRDLHSVLSLFGAAKQSYENALNTAPRAQMVMIQRKWKELLLQMNRIGDELAQEIRSQLNLTLDAVKERIAVLAAVKGVSNPVSQIQMFASFRLEQLASKVMAPVDRCAAYLSLLIDSARFVEGHVLSATEMENLQKSGYRLLIDGLIASYRQSVRSALQLETEQRNLLDFLRDPRLHSIADVDLRRLKSVSIDLQPVFDALEDHVVCEGIRRLDVVPLKQLVSRYKAISMERMHSVLQVASKCLEEFVRNEVQLNSAKNLDQFVLQLRTLQQFIESRSEGRVRPAIDAALSTLEAQFLKDRISGLQPILDAFAASYIHSILVDEVPLRQPADSSQVYTFSEPSAALKRLFWTVSTELVSRDALDVPAMLLRGVKEALYNQFKLAVSQGLLPSREIPEDRALLLALDAYVVHVLCRGASGSDVFELGPLAAVVDSVTWGTHESLVQAAAISFVRDHEKGYLLLHGAATGLQVSATSEEDGSSVAVPTAGGNVTDNLFCHARARIPYVPVADTAKAMANENRRAQAAAASSKSSTLSFVENVVGQKSAEWFSFLNKR